MKHIYFWVGIAVLGLALYLWPGLFVQRMYEGFATSLPPPYPEMAGWLNANPTPTAEFLKTGPPPTAPPQVQMSIKANAEAAPANLPASEPPKQTPPSLDQLAQLQAILDTPVASPTAPPPTVNAVGAKEQPKECESTRSKPADPYAANPVSMALQHGQSYLSTKPVVPIYNRQLQEVAPLLAANAANPVQPIVVNVVPEQSQPNVCPDMRDYIRKDSIPCWGCKLK